MKTTATNRKIRELLTQLRTGRLEPRPDFQRRLVWNNKDKSSFLDTVLNGYPFPEIYVAAGNVDLETGEGSEMLVDGQQRITTLNQFFSGSPDLILSKTTPSYKDLNDDQKEGFLQYDVVVRDLGKLPIEEIREVFRRINATSYSLNAMEVHNARYEGAFKAFAERWAQSDFFAKHRIFSPMEIRRMEDTRFVVTVLATVMSTYFHRDDAVEQFLEQYNDDFPQEAVLETEIRGTLEYIEAIQLPPDSRAWKKADLFTLLVELHRGLYKEQLALEHGQAADKLGAFYSEVNQCAGTLSFDESFAEILDQPLSDPAKYYKSALQATNDRKNRLARGEILHRVLFEVPKAKLKQPKGRARGRSAGKRA